jgi:hypothetical protein|tara:strand:- start:878 stop:1135 length:258 start_codon:yes stop_codon:yes gene_type:complete
MCAMGILDWIINSKTIDKIEMDMIRRNVLKDLPCDCTKCHHKYLRECMSMYCRCCRDIDSLEYLSAQKQARELKDDKIKSSNEKH